jgi:hypothetical protein
MFLPPNLPKASETTLLLRAVPLQHELLQRLMMQRLALQMA